MRYIKNSIKNLIIAILVCLCVLSSVEIYLDLKNKEPDNYDSVCEENAKNIILQLESDSLEKFFTSGTNVVNAKSYETLETEPEFSYCYPLIGMTSETVVEDAFNIVVLGDSFVWGAYSLNRNELFWRLLENDFRNEGIAVNVFGVGTTGANAYEELSWLTDYSLIEDLKPDLVIFGYVYNDSEYADEIDGETVNWEEELPLLSKAGKLLPNIYSRLIERISAKTMYTDKYSDSEYVNHTCAPPVLKGRFYEKYKTDFVEKLDEFASTVDFPIAVVTLPTLPDNLMLEELYKPLEELYAGCENVHYYNSVESYNEFACADHAENYSVNVADFHPGSATNRFYADYIKQFIQEDFSDLIKVNKKTYTKTNSITINEFLPWGVSPLKVYEDESTTRYSVEYPDTSVSHSVYGIEVFPYCLVEPLGKEHIKLSFSDSVYLNEISLKGDYDSVELYYTCLNKNLGYDDHKIYEADKLSDGLYTVGSDAKITSIIISAEFIGKVDRNIDITFKQGGGDSK